MAAGTNILFFPIYAAAMRIAFPWLDADGDLVTGVTGADTEISKDAGTFSDCTNEATEIATTSGIKYLDLTGTEMTADMVCIISKGTGVKTTPLVMYPRRLPSIRAATAQAGAEGTITLDASASAKDDFYNGCYVQCTNNDPAGVQGLTRTITDYVGSTKVASIAPNWATDPTSATTFSILVPENAIVNAWAGVAVADPGTAGVPDTNVKYVSDDSTAADNWEAILDGTGEVTLTLENIVINNSNGIGLSITGSTDGVKIVGSAGSGIEVDGTTFGVEVDASAGPGFHVGGTTFGMELTASAGPGLSAVASAGNNSGVVASKAGTGYDIDADIHGTLDTVTTATVATDVTNRVTADMAYIHGTALTETAGQLAGRFVNFFDQASAGFNISTSLASFKATGFSTHGDPSSGIETHGDANWITAMGFSTHNAAAVVTAMEAGTTLTLLTNIAEGDVKIAGTSPYTMTVYIKDTATPVVAKYLYTKAGGAIDAETDIVGQQLESTL